MLGFGAIARRIFGSENDRRLKAAWARVETINAFEPELEALDDDALKARTQALKERLAKLMAEKGADGDDVEPAKRDTALVAVLDTLLPEAFAMVREAARRSIGLRHFDVQLVGGMVLHEGRIAEMKTGEGKTLVATLPVYLNALAGRGVHVVTVNDYLAKRDAEWMGQVYAALGMTTGVVVPGLDDAGRRAAYACDVTYATNNELGFDYLRDNMKYKLSDMAQREHFFAIVDEVDSILVDEARTPLIISGPTNDQTDLYVALDKVIPSLSEDHYEIDEKQKSVVLTEEGVETVEAVLRESGRLTEDGTLYDPGNVSLVHHTNQALRAHKLFTRDKDYIVRNNQVVIIDEFTGRMMAGRRYSEGLHQALEAKEGVEIQPENVTLASVTFQNYFRLYKKLAGMTGTAMTEASEFAEIYGLQVIEVPTNQPVAREDDDDLVFRTTGEKIDAIVEAIKEGQESGQPILVGTTSIEKSEELSALLKKQDVEHQVLNARYHEQEAYIIAQAGRPGAVTIATNMAGRGTDIQLGGNVEMRVAERVATEVGDRKGPTGAPAELAPDRMEAIRAEVEAEVGELKEQALKAGGLWVIATERHESRRIDNQLRGRSGRQGDPGRSTFYLSLQDDLMRIFGSDKMDGMLRRLGLQEGEAIIHPWVNKAIERSQGKVEARNFDIRKNLLKYDDVMNDQRRAIFEQRREIMEAATVTEMAQDMRHEVIEDLVGQCMPERAYAEQWDVEKLDSEVRRLFGTDLPIKDWAAEEGVDDEIMRERLLAETDKAAARKATDLKPEVMRDVEKAVLLQTIDHHWREHLLTLDHLRSVIGLRGYGQRDPLNEYKSEAFQLFESLLSRLRYDVTGQLMNVTLAPPPAGQPAPRRQPVSLEELASVKIDVALGDGSAAEREKEPVGAGAPAGGGKGKPRGAKGKRRR